MNNVFYNTYNKNMKKYFRLFLPIILGSLVGLFIKGSMDYNILDKPFLAPPGTVFPIAWSILYLLIGVSYYLFRKSSNDLGTIKLYYGQLIVNLLWPILFFVFKLRFVSILWIIFLLLLIVLLMNKFKRIDNTSFILLLPYLLWTMFATYLNIGIYVLN